LTDAFSKAQRKEDASLDHSCRIADDARRVLGPRRGGPARDKAE